MLIQWWLQNPNRTGKANNPDGITQALPLIGAGFQMTGDFLPVPKPAPRTEAVPSLDEALSRAEGSGVVEN